VGLVYTLSQHHLRPDVAKDATNSKNEVRQLIQTAMTGIRSDPRHADALTLGENKIRCHKQGHALTDLYLFGPNHALPVIESVTMVDMETGEIRDAHEMFGLVVKKLVSSTRQTVAHGAADRMAVLQTAKQRAELQLDTLQGAHPFFTETKKEHIKAIEDTIEGMLKESKFEYAPELKAKHGDRVKLSDLLQIGISNGVIDPENDFVVVYACRVPDERVLFPVRSPRGSDSEGSVGGTRSNKKQKCKGNQRHKRKTCKRRRN
jgi:ribosomal protein L31